MRKTNTDVVTLKLPYVAVVMCTISLQHSHTLSLHCKSFIDAEEENLALNVVLLYFSVPFKHLNEMKISPNCGLFIVFSLNNNEKCP